jgi:FtsP/CotA-like multicopper oxidase with cupredoxin domain
MSQTVEFSSDQPQEGSPETQFRRSPDVRFHRDFFSRELRFPDGREYEVWSFEDERSGRALPAPLIRAREGQIVHVTVKPSKSAHTIHLHGIEPDPRNDGVGHTSFEVTGEYTYQFRPDVGEAGNPNRGAAGTYFYHCHVNTPLHVQMGMFGSMIIDPPSGRGLAFFDDPVGYDLRAETLLVPYSVDPRWHEMNHAAGLSGEDVGLNRFQPKSFYLLGGSLDGPPPRGEGVRVVGDILATLPPAKPGLLRINNATYMPTVIRFGGGLEAEIIAHDGRALRDTSRTPSPPVSVRTTVVAFGAAERYDLRLRPPAGARSGSTYPVTVEWQDWITGRPVLGTRQTRVRVL